MTQSTKRAKYVFPLLAGALVLAPAPSVSSALSIDIGIKPFGEPNSINLFSEGVIPVAILRSETFDAQSIDGDSLAFGPGGVPLAHRQDPHWEDVNGDGLTDLVAHFPTQETGIPAGATEACATGVLVAGIPFEGCDAIRTLPRSLCPGTNLATSSGFEVPVTADGPPFTGIWQAFIDDELTGPDVARTSTLMPRTGLQSLELGIIDTPFTFAGVFQGVVGLTAGQAVNYSGWHRVEVGPSGIEIRIEWRDSATDTEAARTPDVVPTPGIDYESFTLEEVVPVGADTARMVYAVQSIEGGASTQFVHVDDVCFSVEAP
jgi:hypothetical protein